MDHRRYRELRRRVWKLRVHLAGERWRQVLFGLAVLLSGALLAAVLASAEPFEPGGFGPGHDARAYWQVELADPYANARAGVVGAYLYSPAFAQLVAPLDVLPWDLFLVAWTGMLLLVLLALVGPLLLAPLLLLALPELWGANIHLLLALAVVAGLRWPQLWAVVLLTKVTPAIGLLWFAARGEWKALGQALLATIAIIVLSAALAPALWLDWLDVLAANSSAASVPGAVPVPLELRMPVAAALIVYAARADRAWLLPIGVMLALPVLWWGSVAMLAGSVALERRAIELALGRLLLGLEVRRRDASAGRVIGSEG